MNATLTPARPATSPSRTSRLDQARAAAKAAGWTAERVTLTADERAETVVEGYGTEGV